MEKKMRLAAYGVCRKGDDLLLARFVSKDGAHREWTLPGGGVDHGEDPYDAVRREFMEETGYEVRVGALLGVTSRRREVHWARHYDLHAVAFVYEVHVVGGELTHEVDGSTDMAAWFTPADLATTDVNHLVRTGVQLARERPADGHLAQLSDPAVQAPAR